MVEDIFVYLDPFYLPLTDVRTYAGHPVYSGYLSSVFVFCFYNNEKITLFGINIELIS